MRSVDTILLSLKQEASKPNTMLNPEFWLEAALDLNVMIGDEQALLFKLQQEIAQRENELYIQYQKMTVAKNLVRATDEYRQMKNQEARVKNIEEFVRLAKARAKMAGNY